MIIKKDITTKSKGKCAIKHSTGARYRLVHDGEKVLALINVDEKAKTESIHTIFESGTEEDCLLEIEKLGLEYEIADGGKKAVLENVKLEIRER